MRRVSSAAAAVLTLALSSASGAQGQGKFVELGPMPFSNAEAGAAVLDGLIYLVGGFNGLEALMVYDPETDSWDRGPDIPQPVHHASAAGFDGLLYVISGHTAESLVQVYDPSTEAWSLADGRVPTPRRAMGIVVFDGRIHVMGGTSEISGGGGHVEHEAYDPMTDTWEKLAPLLEPREHGYAGVIDDKIYFASGRYLFGVRPELQIYDPKTDSWSFGPDLIEAVSGHAVQVVDNRLYVFGGEDVPNRFVTDRTQRYDPFAEVWEEMTDLPMPLHAASNVAFGGSIYLFGGVHIVEGSSRGIRNVLRFDPPDIRNPAPRKLKAKVKKSGKVRLKWKFKRGKSDAVSFQLQVREEKGDWEELATPGIKVKKLFVKDLARGRSYLFRIRANGPAGPSGWSNERSVTLPD